MRSLMRLKKSPGKKPLPDPVTINPSLARPGARKFIQGRGRYLDDVTLTGMRHVCFVRSPYAHAKIISMATSAALGVSGVSHVITGWDLAAVCQPWTAKLTNLGEMKTAPQAALPTDLVKWQGEPVAAVVASSRAVAEDAAELVEVEYTELPAVVDPEAALQPGAPLVHPQLGTNTAWSINIDTGEVDEALAGADVVIEKTFTVNRQTGVTLEPRGVIADYNPAKRYLTLYLTSQVPHIQRYIYARQLGLNEANVRIICPDIGGGFGLKLHVYPDEVASAAISMLLGRPVKFVADRLESFVSDIHAREHRVKAKIGVNNDGQIQVMEVDDLAAAGPYLIHPRTSVIEPLLVAICTPLAYDLRHYRANASLVYQNKVSTGQYRGVGMPVASLVAEGLVDAAARAIGLDKAEIRKRNLFKDDAYPVTGISGEYLECLSQQASLDKLLQMMDYNGLLEERDVNRNKGIYKGIGLATVVEGTSPGPALYAAGGAPISSRDACALRLEAGGNISCATGLTDQGQGGEAVIALLIADVIGIPVDEINVVMGDTATTPFGGGTWASRGTAIAGEACLLAATEMRARILEVAATVHEQPADILTIKDGEIFNLETNEKVTSLAEIGHTIHFNTHTLPPEFEPELIVTRHYSQRQQLMIYANCALGVSLEVNVNTGLITLLKIWAVDDCGRIINEKLVVEQMRGSIVQGVGSCLYEECIYDAAGQLLNGNMFEYLVPMAGEMPDIECSHIETPTKATRLGAKGCGEAGIIAICGAIMNGINDALEPFGAEISSQPFTPEKILRALGKI